MTSSNSRIVIATRNPGKTVEIQILLGELPFELYSIADFEGVGIAPEFEPTYAGNAIAKAQFYAAATGEFVLADDSGLEVDALNGAPGVLSARYAGPDASDDDRRKRLLAELNNSENRSARFVCAVAFAAPNQEVLSVVQGICEGSISREERGTSGFGYDPLFIPDGYEATFGELPDSIKNQISHRGKAITAMKAFLLSKNW